MMGAWAEIYKGLFKWVGPADHYRNDRVAVITFEGIRAFIYEFSMVKLLWRLREKIYGGEC